MTKSDTKKPGAQPLKVNLGPLAIEGSLGLVGSLLLGIVIGAALALFDIAQWQQPSFLIDPVINAIVAKKNPPKPEIKVIDPSTGQPKLPQLGRYLLNPGEKIRIKVEAAADKQFKWYLDPRDFGDLSGDLAESEVTFIAPSDVTSDRAGSVIACMSPTHDPCPVDSSIYIYISTSASPK